ncbi:MAG: HAMP domain-containing protein [Pelotomaculum sp.]|uniref:Methyl-accepting chemotaxis protein n=1 Tax=Pelotomaculum thermopropionicum (strain DSM 13744 / JCM 10971 / SI) TaxID=370438 RepID=A5D293_PELTS|nr:HAMP domain-containing protein [Pelotomaculum sp.]BAF59636.1 methyl-accepting chemotaxis protein [Pelotomaculum thermopropionicum SI]
MIKKIPGSGRWFSVTTKIALALSLLIVFLISAVGISLLIKDQAIFKSQLQEKGWNIAHSARISAGFCLQAGSLQLLNSLLEEIASFNDVSYAAVLDAKGKVLAHTEKNQAGNKINEEEVQSILAINSDFLKIRTDEKGKPAVMEFYSPAGIASGSPAGYLLLGIDLTALNRHARQTAFNIALICLAAAWAGISLSALISKRIIQKPLKDLAAATERVATGDFSCKVPVRNQDELGDLAVAFNMMTFHLANLIQSVKSGAEDISKSAEQIVGRLKASDLANSRLSQTFNSLNQETRERLSALKDTIALTEELSRQSARSMDLILQALGEVSKIAQTEETNISLISRIAACMEESGQTLNCARDSFAQLKNTNSNFSQTIERLDNLLSSNTACTARLALHAARSGSEELVQIAEDLHSISGELSKSLKFLTEDLANTQKAWPEVQAAFDRNLNMLAEILNTVKNAGEALQRNLNCLLQNKEIISEIASAAHRQSEIISDILNSQAGINTELINSISKSTGAENDTKLQMENLHAIESLVKKLARMVERLDVLSLQFKV